MFETRSTRTLCFLALCSCFSLAQAGDLRDTLTGPSGSWFSTSMVFLGDWNGDGHDEFAVGAPQFPGGGMVRIVSGADLSTLWEGTRPPSTGGSFGWSLADGKDVNLDGYRDLVVGSRGGSSSFNTGWVFVYSGEWIVKTAAGQTPQSNLLLHSIESPTGGDRFGETVLGGLNMDNDGHYDFLVGGTGPSAGDFLHAGVVRAYAGIDGSLLWEVSGDKEWAFLGSSLAKIRPNNVYDSDGMQDYLVGADGGGQYPGEVWVLSAPTGALHAKLSPPLGVNEVDQFGSDIAVVGDTDGDGRDDFAIGAPYYIPDNNPGTTFGAVFLVRSGSPDCSVFGNVGGFHVGIEVAATGDINGDGVADFAAVGNLLSSPTLYSGEDCSLLDTLVPPTGATSNLAGGGDLDNDGFNEVLTGDTSLSTVYVYGTGDIYVPADVDSAWLIRHVSSPETYLTVRHPTWGFEGQQVLVETEYDHGGGWLPGPSEVFTIPVGAPPQLDRTLILDHGPVPYVLFGSYDYRTRMTRVGFPPTPWSAVTSGHPSADRDRDWDIDVIDLGVFARALGTSAGDPWYDPLSDLNSDGTVDIIDIGLWAGWRFVINQL